MAQYLGRSIVLRFNPFEKRLDYLTGPYGKGYPRGKMAAALRAGHPPNNRKAVWGMARPQGIEGLGIAGRGETLGSPSAI
jgi:hypothetical protein